MKLTTLIRITMAAGFLSTQFIALADEKTAEKPALPPQPIAKPSSVAEVITKQETEKGIPQNLLRAIAKIESGLSPWAVNAGGRAHMFRSKEAAASYVRELVDQGTTNFSVGCMQLHYASHRRNFKSIEAMLEPQNNIAHAAKLIKNLERRHGSIERAIKYYHSASPAHHNAYKSRVYGMWAKLGRRSSLQKGDYLKTVALKTQTQKPQLKTSKRISKIKFGVGAASSKKRKTNKV
ncbi:MAG: transglycosylase SLT domain-containing protein [Alphaproteobacteria bacterium]|jgi:soluble lytic murein transglycosylase-like protein|nr:transglycosylase SLT domain-containing protein [Alphaproteobacteria bacterium]